MSDCACEARAWRDDLRSKIYDLRCEESSFLAFSQIINHKSFTMAFVDEITLHIKAGNGGNGIVSWLHEKGTEFMGPAGGDGGKGGDVYFKAVRDISRLASYRYGNLFVAESGDAGQKKSRHGKDGKDIELEVPMGSVIVNQKTGRTYELLTEGERVKVLHGGRGGLGNEHFKGST